MLFDPGDHQETWNNVTLEVNYIFALLQTLP